MRGTDRVLSQNENCSRSVDDASAISTQSGHPLVRGGDGSSARVKAGTRRVQGRKRLPRPTNCSNDRQIAFLKRVPAVFEGAMGTTPGMAPGGAEELSRGQTSPRVTPPVPANKHSSPRMGRWIHASTIRRVIAEVRDPAPCQGANRLAWLSRCRAGGLACTWLISSPPWGKAAFRH